MSEPARQFKQPWSIWAHNKLTLYGEPWKDKENPTKKGNNRPSLKYKVWENNPRFNVYMNNGLSTKTIPFALDTYIAYALFELVQVIANDTERKATRYAFELKSKRDHKGNVYDKPTSVAKIYIGRDNEGVMYICFHAKGEDIAKFPFEDSYWASLTDSSGEACKKDFLSELRAKAWANALRELTSVYTVVFGKEKVIQGGNDKKTGSWNKSKPEETDDEFGEDVEF